MLNRRSFLLGSAAALAFSTAARSTEGMRPSRLRQVDAATLSAPIEIIDDPYGVPHIRAGSIPDAFFGQGYVVARDRLFQIDLSHRREMGQLAEAFGREGKVRRQDRNDEAPSDCSTPRPCRGHS